MNDIENPDRPAVPESSNPTPEAIEAEVVAAPGAEAEAAPRPLEAPIEDELAAVRRELEASREEHRATAKRLDEIARAYSALVNDQQDFRARLEREKQRVLETERGKVAQPLLEIADELERALAAVPAGEREDGLPQGVRLIREELLRRLSLMGIERMRLVGTQFDPNLAEAIDLVAVDDRARDGEVVAEVIAGYKLGERVLREARVTVARFAEVPLPTDVPQQ